jgi:hypothetical protein
MTITITTDNDGYRCDLRVMHGREGIDTIYRAQQIIAEALKAEFGLAECCQCEPLAPGRVSLCQAVASVGDAPPAAPVCNGLCAEVCPECYPTAAPVESGNYIGDRPWPRPSEEAG